MAIRPEDEYGTRATPANADYPHGSAKNETTPGADDGTPYTADFRNDLWGFFQRLLEEAGITPNGDPDTVTDSQYWNGLQAEINKQTPRPAWTSATQLGLSLIHI